MEQEFKDGYIKNGVIFSPINTPSGNQLTIKYKGLLKESEEPQIYARVGYGYDYYTWEEIQDIAMTPTQNQDMEITIPLIDNQITHVAFHNGEGIWDNNNGMDYHFKSRIRPQW
ncbi:MAG: hypothetical protein GX347_09385, partial [Epulopiscium sp.]|nr:hypothetical protein [Candidatus Epulonipiscium sp.]